MSGSVPARQDGARDAAVGAELEAAARAAGLCLQPLPDAPFGTLVSSDQALDSEAFVALACAHPALLPAVLRASNGLAVVKGLLGIRERPRLLVELSALFGTEVEDYTQTLTPMRSVHPQEDRIFVVSNLPPYDRQPPARPDPPLTADGALPTRFPHRRGWHTDQSYRRPPPDISLFYAAQPAPRGQAQTLYASGTLAWASLPQDLRARADGLIGLHAQPGSGRAEALARAGETPPPLEPHRRPQPQPVLRRHPETGEPALFLCEAGQMDWYEGPFVGLEPGPHGEGARLLYALMEHYTRPEHVYVHEWDAGDLVIYDNRNTIHAATWFDAGQHPRIMWRTTVRGNPGPEYDGVAPSWIPR